MSARVLLVEDDPLSLKLMRDLLQAHGFETFEVSNGDDAQGMVEDVRPALVVMDIGLAGMDGVEATRRLRSVASTSSIPILAVTAYAMPGDEQRMREAGCDAYLTKPLHFAHFLELVRQLTGANQPGEDVAASIGSAK